MSFTRFIIFVFVKFAFISVSKCECDLNRFIYDEIAPKVIPHAPASELKVQYSQKSVNCGDDITRSATKQQPDVSYEADRNKYYTLVMIDPDAPSRKDAKYAPFLHWLVVNIQGANVWSGEVLTDYMQPSPPASSGPHRYIFLIYEQSRKLTKEDLDLVDSRKRPKFNMKELVENWSLLGPNAGNFFYTSPDTN